MEQKLLDYFNGEELPASVFSSKYKLDTETTPDDMHWRMAKQFARIEKKYEFRERKLDGETIQKLSRYGRERDTLQLEGIYSFFKNFKYIIPQGSVMSQLGADQIGSLSNCFVIGQPYDSYGGIMYKDQELAQLMKRRGGVGLDISTLRPESTVAKNAAKSSTGAISFMHRFSNTTREVAQNGRRGALMLSIDVDHPDVYEFVKIKRDLTQVTGANISIKLNDSFMEAVNASEDYFLTFPCGYDLTELSAKNQHELANDFVKYPYHRLVEIGGGLYVKRIPSKDLYDEIIESAHGVAEPGLMFWDNMIDYSPDGVYEQFKAITTNPCSEIGMGAYDACRLIANNLFSFVINPFTDKAYFDYDLFYKINYEAMRLSDDLVDLELEHIQNIQLKIMLDPEPTHVKRVEMDLWDNVERIASASRRTGLGFTALGDALAALGIKYDSDEGLAEIEKICKTKLKSELDCTTDLAILRGAFKGWNKDKEFIAQGDSTIIGANAFYQMLVDEFPEEVERMRKYGRRNVSWSTVAPTGSLSIIAKAVKNPNVSSGLEPQFMPYYMRRKKVNPGDKDVRVDFTDQNGDTWQEYPVMMGAFKDWMVINQGINPADLENYDSEGIEKMFKKSPWYGATANDIDWVRRVEIQGLIQRYITHSISSTINLPKDVSKEAVAEIYFESWRKGLKGITVYRDGSRSGVLVSSTQSTVEDKFDYKDAVKRPKELSAETHTTTCKGKKYNVIVGLLDGKPYEVFVDGSDNKYSSIGMVAKQARGRYIFKNGGDPVDIRSFMSNEEEAITRLVSANLRHGTDVKFVVEQLQKTDGTMFDFTKGLARVLKKYIPNGEVGTGSMEGCETPTECNLIFEEGCHKCLTCGKGGCG